MHNLEFSHHLIKYDFTHVSTIKIYFVWLPILLRKCSAFVNIIYPYSKLISLLCCLNVSVSSNDTSIFLALSSVLNPLTEWHHQLLVCILSVVNNFVCSYFICINFCGYLRKTTSVTFCPFMSLSCFITK